MCYSIFKNRFEILGGNAKFTFLISWEPIMGKLSNLKHNNFVRNRIEWRKEEKMVFCLYPSSLRPSKQNTCNSSELCVYPSNAVNRFLNTPVFRAIEALAVAELHYVICFIKTKVIIIHGKRIFSAYFPSGS